MVKKREPILEEEEKKKGRGEIFIWKKKAAILCDGTT
jgi:hypothetical protein